jgi:hypothetical protein
MELLVGVLGVTGGIVFYLVVGGSKIVRDTHSPRPRRGWWRDDKTHSSQ